VEDHQCSQANIGQIYWRFGRTAMVSRRFLTGVRDAARFDGPMRSVAAAAFFRWFPDKKSLLLVEYAPAGRAFRRLDLATGQARTLFEAKQSALSAIVSTDGRAILYPVTDLENRRMKHLMLRDLEGGEEKSVLDTETGGDGSAAFQGLTGSPDGRLVAYIGSGPQAKESDRAIWVASVPGGEPRELWRPKDKQFSSIQFLTWDAHGRGVLVSVKSNEPARGDEVWYVPVDGGAPHAIGITMPGLVVSSVHPDNQHIGLTASSSTEQLWTLKNLFADNRSAR
jgi:Tol biopolymer transport system component